jgi:hypothetical protein
VRLASALAFVLTVALTASSCRERGGKYIDQGEIHYNIDYVGNLGPVPKEVLPKNLIVSFKHDKILFEMLSTFGHSGILNLTNPEKGIFDTYFSLFSIKYFYAAEEGEPSPGFDTMKGMIINKTTKTAIICGFNCKNAVVNFPLYSEKVFDIWYTNEIDIVNPNGTSPYNDIDGVLMSFVFIMGPSELHFTAETVYKKDIPETQFERREKFTRVSREDINKFINKMVKL